MEPKTAVPMEKIVLGAHGLGHSSRAVAHLLEAGTERADDGGQGFEERDEPGRSYGPRAHGLDIGCPQIAGRHLRDRDGPGVDRSGQILAEKVKQRHDDKPGEDAAGEDNPAVRAPIM